MEETWWEKRSELWAFLEEYTEGDAQKLVKCMKKENGWEAWRRLNKHFEAGVAAREAGVRQAFCNMNNKKAKTPAELQSLMVELEEKHKKYTEVTGAELDEEWHKQVIMGMIDQTANTHTMQHQRLPLAEYKWLMSA